MNGLFRIFITSSVGCEQVLFDEVQKTGKVDKLSLGKGGVWAEVHSFSTIMYLNYALHTANRVLVELISVDKPKMRDIYYALFDYDWTSFFKDEETFAIEVPFSAHRDFTNTLFAAQFMKDPICDRLKKERGKRPFIDLKNPEIRFQAFLTESKFCFYFDSSNIPLFKRGYRADKEHIAPLKETLAASLLLSTGFQPEKERVIDPCAGSGTFIIESLLLQYNIAPGLFRKEFGFKNHPLYDQDEERLLKQMLHKRAEESGKGIISQSIGIERDKMMYRTILQSLAKIGLLDKSHIIHDLFQRVSQDDINNLPPTFLITNPPYGVRMQHSRDQIEELYRDLGQFAKKSLRDGGRAVFLIPQEGNLQKLLHLRPTYTFPVFQGGLDCRCAVYDIFPPK